MSSVPRLLTVSRVREMPFGPCGDCAHLALKVPMPPPSLLCLVFTSRLPRQGNFLHSLALQVLVECVASYKCRKEEHVGPRRIA